jgi:hypothetical protein
MKHIASGAQLIKPGQSSRLLANAPVTDLGETTARAAMHIDSTVYVMGMEREIVAEGEDRWTLELATTSLVAQNDAALLAQLAGDFDGGQSDVKPYNFHDTIDMVVPVATGAGIEGAMIIPTADVLAIHKCTLKIQRLNGSARDTYINLYHLNGGGVEPIELLGADFADQTEYDLTDAITQPGTPVPWEPTTYTGSVGDLEGIILAVGATDPTGFVFATDFSVVVEMQASKLSLPPS